ncbi:MAG: hypothetical protein ACRDHK_16090, partial [Actinomycetota bacterium]
ASRPGEAGGSALSVPLDRCDEHRGHRRRGKRSQGHGIVEHMDVSGAERRGFDDVDHNTEEFFEVEDQAGEVEEGTPRLESTRKSTSLGMGVAPSERPEQANVVGAPPSGRGEDLAAVLAHQTDRGVVSP